MLLCSIIILSVKSPILITLLATGKLFQLSQCGTLPRRMNNIKIHQTLRLVYHAVIAHPEKTATTTTGKSREPLEQSLLGIAEITGMRILRKVNNGLSNINGKLVEP